MSRERAAVRILVALSVVAALGGCETVKALQYRNADLSAKPKGALVAVLVHPGVKRQDVEDANEAFRSDASLLAEMEQSCQSPQKMAPILVPIVGAAIQLGFESLVASQERRVQSIVDSAKATYSTTIVIPPDNLVALNSGGCLVVLRYTSGSKGPQPQLGALLRFTAHDPGGNPNTRLISFQPVYFRMNQAVAGTMADKPTVSTSFAVSIKAVGRDGPSELRRLAAAGEAVASVSDVRLETPSHAYCTKQNQGCPASDLMAFPTNRGALSLTLGVAEQGKTGFDDKAASAELAAIKAAIGPALSEGVKAKYAPD